MNPGAHPGHTLILGGQKSGKSRAAEARAAAWLAGGAGRRAVLLATAQAGDAEMAERIARHRADRAARVPGLATEELAGADGHRSALASALAVASQPDQLVVVDCLTLWLTQLAMPLHGPAADEAALQHATDALLAALRAAPGPVVLVSNEIGLGVSPLLAPVRRFIDALGRLHQQVATVCDRVTLMVAGCEIVAKPGVAA